MTNPQSLPDPISTRADEPEVESNLEPDFEPIPRLSLSAQLRAWLRGQWQDTRVAVRDFRRQYMGQGIAIGVIVAVLLFFYALPDAETRRMVIGGMLISSGVLLVVIGPTYGYELARWLNRQYAALWETIHRQWAGFQEGRMRMAVAAAILALVAMGLAAERFLPGANDAELMSGLRYTIFGAVVVGFALFASNWSPPVLRLSDERLRPVASNALIFALGVIVLIVLAEANGHLLGWKQFEDVPHQDQFVWLVAGVTLVVMGLGGVKLPKLADWRPSRATALEWLMVIGVTVLGLGVRVWRLETAVHWFVDELNFGTVVSAFWGPANIPLLRPEIRGFPTIFAYLQNWGVMQYGRNLQGLRMLSVVLGTLTIPAIYLLGRELVDKRTGLMAAVLLTALPPHIQFSRLALNNIGDPLFGTLAFAFMARAFRTQRRVDYALSGAALGLTQYFYEGGRLLYPPLMVGWVCIGLIFWRPQPSLKGLIIAALAAFMVGMPIYYTLHGLDLPLTARFSDVGKADDAIGTTQNEQSAKEKYVPRIKEAFRVYVNLPEFRALYYGGDTPLLLQEIVPLFLLGGAFALWRVRTPLFLLFMWIIAASIGNSLIQDPSVSARFVVVFPAMALLAAVGIRHSFALIVPREVKPAYQTVVMVGLVAALAIVQVDYFMGPHLERYNVQIRQPHTKDGEDALFRSVDFPAGTQIYIVGDYVIDEGYARGIMGYLKLGMWVQTVPSVGFTPEFLEGLPRTGDIAFYIAPENVAAVNLLRQYFALLPPQETPYDVPEDKKLILYYAPLDLQPVPEGKG